MKPIDKLRKIAIENTKDIMTPGDHKDEKLLHKAQHISSQEDFLLWAQDAAWDSEAAHRAMNQVGVKRLTNKALRILHNHTNWST